MTEEILITGATGTVGKHVVKYLDNRGISFRIATRNPHNSDEGNSVNFDFYDKETHGPALKGISSVFLVRPPPIGDADVFEPFFDNAKVAGVEHIVFLSLLGINPFTPHWGIEKLIKKSNFDYTFLRAGFFMQNLMQTHIQDILYHNEIFIPAGGGKTSFIDARDIAEVAAVSLIDKNYRNTKLKLTGKDKLSYYEVAYILSEVTGKEIEYSNPSAKEFRKRMRSYGLENEYISVMINLYRLTRFKLAGKITNTVSSVLERQPRSFETFARDYRSEFVVNV